jgi:polyisoprenoid-binding protein YceI
MNTGGKLLAVLLWAILTVTPALAQTWIVVAGHDATEVVFKSKATLESFEGRTRAVTGWINLELPGTISWHIEVDLADLDTGIGLRNRHMRENHLHTDEYPTAVFEGEQNADSIVGSEMALFGSLTLHGVTVERTIEVHLTQLTDGDLTASAEFGISLADHEIARPGFLMMKLADVQQLRVRLLARPTPEENP